MKEIDFARCLLHDSAKEEYRSPLGAVTAGTKVAIRLKVRDLPFQACYLTVLPGAFKIEIEMHSDGQGYMYAEYDTPSSPNVIWYYFTINLDGFNRIYYGPDPGWRSGLGRVYWSVPPAFQLTLSAQGFKTPDWFKGSIMYQIFPDRFAMGNPEQMEAGYRYHLSHGRNFRLHGSWDEQPEYQPFPGEQFYQPSDFFGGDLAGIESRLDYLEEMGISAIYLNPIFEAASNHRYNTSDYMQIDPILGTVEDFERLAEKAKGRGIRLILDGVFSHTGADSVYFNRNGNYNSVGAYQSKDSPYYEWYTFFEYPDKYRSWWGFETLPEVDETRQDWVDFIIKNDDSVINTWLDRGASGYRLDVADELPDITIQQIREEVKENNPEDVVIGEVWEDATTKESYGVSRKYALGMGLDSVMNYPLLNATVDFLTDRIDAYAFKRFLVSQASNYPKEMYYALMNILSSHDVARVRTLLATRVQPHDLSREQQAFFRVSDEQDMYGAKLQKLAATVQFTIPGCPCVYYGDEGGMNGLLDPFNRKPFRIRDADMQEFYKKVAQIRKTHDALRTGWVSYSARSANVLATLRWALDGVDAIGNPASDGVFVSFINRSARREVGVCDLYGCDELMTNEQHEKLRKLDFPHAQSLLTGKEARVEEGLVSWEIEPLSADILKVWFEIPDIPGNHS